MRSMIYLFGASPILSWKCSYKPIFVNTAVSGKEQIIDYIVDAYVSDMNNEKVYEIIDRIKMARQKFGVKSETSHPTQPNQLFANILRYLLSRDQRIMGHRLLEKSSLGYINPIFEHYHKYGPLPSQRDVHVHRYYGGVRSTAHSPLPAQGAPLP